MDLSIIIISYNTRALLRQCLESISRYPPRRSFEVIVVDNNSRDGSPEMTKAVFPLAKLVVNHENKGYAKANNQGVQVAEGNNILFLNSDTRALPRTFDTLLGFLDSHPECGIVGGRLLNPDGTIQASGKRFPLPVNILFGRKSFISRRFPNNRITRNYLLCLDQNLAAPFEVDYLSGAGLMIRKALIEEIGLFDERFFMYWEDADLCHRVKAAGWKVAYHPKARIIHNEGGSAEGHRTRMIREFHRSIYYYYTKHHLQGIYRPLRVIALAALSIRATILITLEFLRSFHPRR